MTRSAARITRPLKPEVFYGWRYIKTVRPDGSEDLDEVPLTLEDCLHPKEGDHIPDNQYQHIDLRYLEPIFQARAERLPSGYVLGDRIINWGVPGIRNHAPDLVVFKNVFNPPQGDFETFRVHDFGGRCVLAVEIVSPKERKNDVIHKFRHYHRVRVPLNVLIDQKRENGPRWVVGNRYTAARYVPMRLDRQGRLPLKSLGLLLAVEDCRAVCYDAETGERIGGYEEVDLARRAAKQRVLDLEAELRRLRTGRRNGGNGAETPP